MIAGDLIAETKAFRLRRLEGDILFFDYHDNIIIELEDIKEAFDLYVEHSNNCSFKVLLAFGQFSTMEVDTRKYAEDKSMPTLAQAVVLRNLAQRMLARFYQLLRKDKHPLKFARSTYEALIWLRSINSKDSCQSTEG